MKRKHEKCKNCETKMNRIYNRYVKKKKTGGYNTSFKPLGWYCQKCGTVKYSEKKMTYQPKKRPSVWDDINDPEKMIGVLDEHIDEFFNNLQRFDRYMVDDKDNFREIYEAVLSIRDRIPNAEIQNDFTNELKKRFSEYDDIHRDHQRFLKSNSGYVKLYNENREPLCTHIDLKHESLRTIRPIHICEKCGCEWLGEKTDANKKTCRKCETREYRKTVEEHARQH